MAGCKRPVRVVSLAGHGVGTVLVCHSCRMPEAPRALVGEVADVSVGYDYPSGAWAVQRWGGKYSSDTTLEPRSELVPQPIRSIGRPLRKDGPGS
jgi:hypothetical protein